MAEKPSFLEWMWGMGDRPEFEEYQQMGGGLSYNQWVKQGKPSPPTALSGYGASRLQAKGIPIDPSVTIGVQPGDYAAIARRTQGAGGLSGDAGYEEALQQQLDSEAEERAYKRRQDTLDRIRESEKFEYGKEQDRLAREERASTAKAKQEAEMTPAQQAEFDYREKQDIKDRQREEDYQDWLELKTKRDREQSQRWKEQEWEQALRDREWERQRFMLEQQADEQSRLSALAAQPTSWLRYAAEANEPPVVQDWMKQLLPEQYQDLQTGSQIPGWSPTDMTNMPALLNPSAQLQSRMGPTNLQELYGYKQARTGQTPEESQYKMWGGGAPTGTFGGYSRRRQSW